MASAPRPGPGRPARAPLAARHPEVARLRRLLRQRSARDDERRFVVEGPLLLAEALAAGRAVEAVYVPAGSAHGSAIDRARGAGVPVIELAPGVLERTADTVTPQPALAVLEVLDVGIDDIAVGQSALVLVLAGIGDPGNAGTVLRTAEAAGAGAVLFCDGSVDVYNPKTVRASAGSLFHVDVVRGGAPVEVMERLRGRGLRCVGTGAHGGSPYHQVDLSGAVALVLGNERHGLPTDLEAHLDDLVSIPMVGRSESLNVGMAAAVLCFEAARQRGVGG